MDPPVDHTDSEIYVSWTTTIPCFVISSKTRDKLNIVGFNNISILQNFYINHKIGAHSYFSIIAKISDVTVLCIFYILLRIMCILYNLNLEISHKCISVRSLLITVF